MLHFFDKKWFFTEEIVLKQNRYASTKPGHMVFDYQSRNRKPIGDEKIEKMIVY